MMNITEDEAALYDRQIRLWGLEAQKRLRAAKVLLVGLRGLGAEIAKNILLAGIKSLTLLDSNNVAEDDLCSQFFITPDDINENRAQRSLARARILNPMVTVTADVESVEDKSDSFFSAFDVIIVTNLSKKTMMRIDKICRENDVHFFAGNVHGYFGYTFSDMNRHEFAEELQTCKTVNPDAKNEPPKIQKEVKVIKRTMTFCSLESALEKDWTSEKHNESAKKLSSSYFVMQCLLEFENIHGRHPERLNKASDVVELLRICEVLLDRMGVNKDKVDKSLFEFVFAQLSPVCAIVGGVLAQEVIKAVSCKDAPLNNFFFYSGLQDSGIVEQVGY